MKQDVLHLNGFKGQVKGRFMRQAGCVRGPVTVHIEARWMMLAHSNALPPFAVPVSIMRLGRF